jgi:hypothetical protein
MTDTLLYALSLLVLPISALLITLYFSRLNNRMVEHAARPRPSVTDKPQ